MEEKAGAVHVLLLRRRRRRRQYTSEGVILESASTHLERACDDTHIYGSLASVSDILCTDGREWRATDTYRCC